MKRLVRGALGILAALAIAAAAQAQVRPRPAPPPAPRPMPMPTPMPRIDVAPIYRPPPVLKDQNWAPQQPSTDIRARAVDVRPPPRSGEEPPPDGEDHCEDSNALNDPDDCGGQGNVSAAAANGAADPIASAFDGASDNAFNEAVANMPTENLAAAPAEPGWRPSWWMIVLGLGGVLLLLGWISDAVRRR